MRPRDEPDESEYSVLSNGSDPAVAAPGHDACSAAPANQHLQEHFMNRNDVTEKIITVKVSKGITWESVAK